ncbi:MAG: NAD(+) synthase [Candidatus Woesearchaeota archaeon]
MKKKEFIPNEKLKMIIDEITNINYAFLIEKLCKQIQDYYKTIPKKDDKEPKVVIGLSGGIDSSVATALATKALGKDKVITITMSNGKHDECIKNGTIMQEYLGTEHYTIDISKIIKKKNEILLLQDEKNKKCLEEKITEEEKIRLGNLASRTRISLLYDFAARVNGRILGTANKTELMLGYVAKWGTPMCYDYGVLGNLYKCDIYKIAERLKIPKEIMNAIPSTGYYVGQTHEKELGASLEELDAAVYLLFEKKYSIEQIQKEYMVDPEFLGYVKTLYENSEHKRQMPANATKQ